MAIRSALSRAVLAAAMLLAGCGEQRSGPVVVSAVGGPPRLVNPNLQSLDAASAYLVAAVAQGLVRFDASGQIEPALAQSWIVSDDGLRYTFRLARLEWEPGRPVTAEQVATRLRAAMSPASRNPLKPQLGLIDEIEAMTGNVLEISLRGPRPNFLQLLAQPEMAIIRNGKGTGPYDAAPEGNGAQLLRPRQADDAEAEEPSEDALTQLVLFGESAARAVARFKEGLADMVTGGTAADLPLVRAAELPATALRFDRVQGLFGLAVTSDRGPLADPQVRHALSMAIDREALVDALGVPGLQPRSSLLPAGLEEVPEPALPEWDPLTPAERRGRATQALTATEAPLTLRVAMPAGHGYRLLFAHLSRDWRAIGVRAERVGSDAAADLRLIDRMAPIAQPAWYLRSFGCEQNPVCDAQADALLEQARATQVMTERRQALAAADRLLTDAAPFIPLAAPVRWSLVSQRLTGFQPNPFASHFPGSLVAPAR